MKQIGITCELVCKSIKQTVSFYVDILGFSIVDETDSWTKLSFGKSQLMFITPKEISKDVENLANFPIGGSFVLLIEVAGIEKYFKDIRNNVKVVKDFYETDYGTSEFVIEDNNGYYLMFCQRDET